MTAQRRTRMHYAVICGTRRGLGYIQRPQGASTWSSLLRLSSRLQGWNKNRSRDKNYSKYHPQPHIRIITDTILQ